MVFTLGFPSLSKPLPLLMIVLESILRLGRLFIGGLKLFLTGALNGVARLNGTSGFGEGLCLGGLALFLVLPKSLKSLKSSPIVFMKASNSSCGLKSGIKLSKSGAGLVGGLMRSDCGFLGGLYVSWKLVLSSGWLGLKCEEGEMAGPCE